MSKQEATRLAEHIRIDQDWCEEAAALLRQWPGGEPVAVHQFRKPGCADWYDGMPDDQDGPAETRTLYTTPPDSAASIAELKKYNSALTDKFNWYVVQSAKDANRIATMEAALKVAEEALDMACSYIDSYYIPPGKTTLPEIEAAIRRIKEAQR